MGNSHNKDEEDTLPLEFNHIDLIVAIRNNDLKKIKRLLFEKDDISFQDLNPNRFSSLHLACYNEEISNEVLSFLFEKKIDVNLLDNYHQTAFHFYCQNKSITMEGINMFIENKVDLFAKDYFGISGKKKKKILYFI